MSISTTRAAAVRTVRRAPVTSGFVVVQWVLGAVTGSLGRGPDEPLRHHVASGVGSLAHGHLWTPLTSAAWAHGLGGYVLGTVVVLALGVPAERRLGSRDYAVAAVLTQVLGVLLALGVVRVAAVTDEPWAQQLSRAPLLGPITFAVGAAMVASARTGTLWRRRVRVGLLAVLVVLALYGGLLSDVVHLSAAVVGLALGPLLHGRGVRGQRLAGTRREGRVLVAIAVAASAVGPVLAAFSPQAVGPLSVLQYLFTSPPPDAATVQALCADPGSVEACHDLQVQLRLSGLGPSILSVLPALLLVVLSDGLRRGRRAAWAGAVALHGVLVGLGLLLVVEATVLHRPGTVVSEALHDVRYLLALVLPLLAPLLVLALLLGTRGLFDVAAPRRTYRRLARDAGVLVAALGAVYVLGGLVLGSGFDRRPGLVALLTDLPLRFVPPGYLGEVEPAFLPVSVPATLLFEWTGVVFWLVLCVLALQSFLRPVLADGGRDSQVRALLRAHGESHLSWMCTWPGNSYWFTPDGSGVVAYRVLLGVAVTVGDPVVPRGDGRLAEAVRGFAEHCSAQGWTPCFYSVTEPVRAATDLLGWSELHVAEETVLPLGSLAFTGKKFQDVRTALNRAAKQGITAEWVSWPNAPLSIVDQVTAISEEWVADKGMPEMGFTLGGLAELDDPEVRCLVAVDADRTVHGITSWLPVHRDGEVVGWTLDFMRRRSEGFRPAMEFLIASAALLLQAEGAELVSLSGAPLAEARPADGASGPTDRADVSGVQRLLEVLGRTLEPVYGFRSLLAFKEKFQPEHSPLFMTWPDPAALPAVANAVGRAYLPEVSLGQGMSLVRKLVTAR